LASCHQPLAISHQPPARTAPLPLGTPASRLSTRRLLQAVRGSHYEGGWRFHVELEPAADAARAPAAPGAAPPASPAAAAGGAAEPPAGASAGLGAAPSAAAPRPAPGVDPGEAAAEPGEPAAAAPAAAERGAALPAAAAAAGGAAAAAGDAPGQPPAADPPPREHGGDPPERDWAPLLYAPAAGEAPAVALRRPLAPARPPAPARKWAVGDRAEARPAPTAAATVQATQTQHVCKSGCVCSWRHARGVGSRCAGAAAGGHAHLHATVARVHPSPGDAPMAQPPGLVCEARRSERGAHAASIRRARGRSALAPPSPCTPAPPGALHAGRAGRRGLVRWPAGRGVRRPRRPQGASAQGFWPQGGSWWPGTVQARGADGCVALKVDPTPTCPQARPVHPYPIALTLDPTPTCPQARPRPHTQLPGPGRISRAAAAATLSRARAPSVLARVCAASSCCRFEVSEFVRV